jgi:hypothetical protein
MSFAAYTEVRYAEHTLKKEAEDRADSAQDT